MRTLCCCIILSFSFFCLGSALAGLTPVSWTSTVAKSARTTEVELAQETRSGVSLATGFPPSSPAKTRLAVRFATASFVLVGHDATGMTRPYRNPSLCKVVVVYQILVCPRKGVFSQKSVNLRSDLILTECAIFHRVLHAQQDHPFPLS